VTEYRVDLAHLDNVTARIAGLQGFVEQSLQEVEERIAGVQANWAGEAADAHATAHAEWAAAAAKIAAGLEKMRAAAAAAHRHYGDASAANIAMLGHGTGAAE
jgi:WXG100 family type VII secretion target